MKKKQDAPLVLTSPEPINDGGRKYNWIYPVCAGISLILFIGIGANLAGVFLGVLTGLCVGWLVKNKILDISSLQLRFIEFEVKNKIPYPALIAELIPRLTPLGMTIEKSDEQNGHPAGGCRYFPGIGYVFGRRLFQHGIENCISNLRNRNCVFGYTLPSFTKKRA